jgi:hypothetical protein
MLYTHIYLRCEERYIPGLQKVRDSEARMRTQNHCTVIKVFRSDSGGEYLGDAFNKHLVVSGTMGRLTFLKRTLILPPSSQ